MCIEYKTRGKKRRKVNVPFDLGPRRILNDIVDWDAREGEIEWQKHGVRKGMALLQELVFLIPLPCAKPALIRRLLASAS